MALTFTNQKLVLVGCILSIWSPLFLGLGATRWHLEPRNSRKGPLKAKNGQVLESHIVYNHLFQ